MKRSQKRVNRSRNRSRKNRSPSGSTGRRKRSRKLITTKQNINKPRRPIHLEHYKKHQVIAPIPKETTKPRYTFSILDNGGEPFVVDVFGRHLDVYQQDERGTHRVRKILSTPFQKLFVGDNYFGLERSGSKPGNSLLVLLKEPKYLYIGHEIYGFDARAGDEILVYASPVGPSAVPYPYAIGKKYVYYMLNKATLPIEWLHDPTSGYDEMYQRFYRPNQTTTLRTKLIQKRIW